jgi:hypothetical protein
VFVTETGDDAGHVRVIEQVALRHGGEILGGRAEARLELRELRL